MQISPILWLAAAVGFLALEASTFNMTSIWFAIGSAAALLCCVFTGSFRVQAVVFLVVSILCLAAFRPLAAKLRLKHTATNGDRNLGREAIVLSPVTAEVPGRVRLDGVDWNARCATPGTATRPPHPAITHAIASPTPNFACNSTTQVTQHHELTHTSMMLAGNCMRISVRAPRLAAFMTPTCRRERTRPQHRNKTLPTTRLLRLTAKKFAQHAKKR